MRLIYYPETDSLYIELRDAPGAETREVADGVRIDLVRTVPRAGIARVCDQPRQ
jgi:uncharacterized protein YuzE